MSSSLFNEAAAYMCAKHAQVLVVGQYLLFGGWLPSTSGLSQPDPPPARSACCL